jgi:hypothetical protein
VGAANSETGFHCLGEKAELTSSELIAGEPVLLFGMMFGLTTRTALILIKDNATSKSDFFQCAPGFSY